jgi:two-component system phosphate regulon sensor histidine kinase PhoR
MSATEGTILVVDPHPAAAEHRATPMAGSSSRRITASVAEAILALAGGNVRICLCADTLADNELHALAHAAQRRGVLCLYSCPQPTVEAVERAMLSGCRGVLAPDDPAAKAAGFLVAADDLRRRHRLEQQEVAALQGRYEALRKRCAQQADRYEVSQETFFLDLSRVMTIISNIMDGIVFLDRDGNVTLLNPVAEDLLGVKAFAAIGKPFASLTGCDELLQPLCRDHRRLETQEQLAQTIEVHHSEQDLLYIKCITTKVSDYRGQPAGSMTVLKDVTSEFKSDQLKNQYLSIVAHELRTPLTGIKTFSTMMGKGTLGELSESQQRVVDSIREQSLRLEHQIDKLINLGHLESDEYGQDRESFTVADFALGLIAPFEQPARDRQIAITFRCDVADDVLLHADRTDLRRASQALIENAVKFTPDGGVVDVRIQPDANGDPELVVRDSGVGVDPRYQRRIFEKFFQVEDPLTRHHGGAGLGLFVAREIVEAHGSRIEVSSQLGQGAEFSFGLPLAGTGSSAGEAQEVRERL